MVDKKSILKYPFGITFLQMQIHMHLTILQMQPAFDTAIQMQPVFDKCIASAACI